MSEQYWAVGQRIGSQYHLVTAPAQGKIRQQAACGRTIVQLEEWRGDETPTEADACKACLAKSARLEGGATQKPTRAQAEMLDLLRQGYRIRAAGYYIDPQGRPEAGYVNRKTLAACRKNGWVIWTDRGFALAEAR